MWKGYLSYNLFIIFAPKLNNYLNIIYMKKLLFILFIAVFTCQVITAQNYAKIDVELQQEMSLRNADELIPINIIMI